MANAHDRAFVRAFFEAADSDGDGIITMQDILDICVLRRGGCDVCRRDGQHGGDELLMTIKFKLEKAESGMTLEDLLHLC